MLSRAVVHQCHIGFKTGDVAEWVICPESYGEHPRAGTKSCATVLPPTRSEDRQTCSGILVSPIWAGCVSLLAAYSIFYWRKNCWYSAKDLPLFTAHMLHFVKAMVWKQQLISREKLNKNNGLCWMWQWLAGFVRRRDHKGWLLLCLIFLKHGTVQMIEEGSMDLLLLSPS